MTSQPEPVKFPLPPPPVRCDAGLLTRLPGLRTAVPPDQTGFREGHQLASKRGLPVTWDEP